MEPEDDDGLVPNEDQFFDVLPEPTKKSKQKRSTLVGLTKSQRIQKALGRLRKRKEKWEARIEKLEE